jgi:hypothetical protein
VVHSSVSGLGGEATDWMTGARFPARLDFCLCHNDQTGSGAHPAFCRAVMVTGVLTSGVEESEREGGRDRECWDVAFFHRMLTY